MKSPPNIVFIISHDTGKYFGAYGAPVKTPNIDRLAEEGVQFTQFFSSAPQCTPSRGGILTGKMPHSNGLMGLTNMGWDLPEHNATIPKLLKTVGYSTHLVGLQHTHHHPKKLGYDTISSRSEAPHMGSTVTRRFKKFIKKVENGEIEQPFFCSVGFFETHRTFDGSGTSPFNPSKPKLPADPKEVQISPLLSQDSPDVREDMIDFVSNVKELDHHIGKIRNLIDTSSIKENTIIIFTVDHGIPMPRQKCTLYDPGIAVPLIVHMPTKIPSGRIVEDLVSNIDILPTLLDIAGVDIPRDVQGNSIAGVLLEGSRFDYTPRDQIYAELTFHDMGFNPIRCIRTKRWKYIKNLVPFDILFEMPDDILQSLSGKAYIKDHPEYHSKRPDEELYDLESDPNEIHNIANNPQFAKIKEELSSKLMEFLKSTNDPVLRGEIEEPERPEKGPKRYIYDLEEE